MGMSDDDAPQAEIGFQTTQWSVVVRAGQRHDRDAQAARATVRELNLADPDTGEPYAYHVTGETSYELSAQFALQRDKTQDPFWNHPAGRHGYTFKLQSPP
jgi:hypothetical protein